MAHILIPSHFAIVIVILIYKTLSYGQCFPFPILVARNLTSSNENYDNCTHAFALVHIRLNSGPCVILFYQTKGTFHVFLYCSCTLFGMKEIRITSFFLVYNWNQHSFLCSFCIHLTHVCRGSSL